MEYTSDLNLDQDRRNQIIFGKPKQSHDCADFNGLTLVEMTLLMDENFVALAPWNSAPSAQVIYDWAMAHASTKILFDGYAISKERSDYRVTIDCIRGVQCSGAFQEAFRQQWGTGHPGEEGWSSADELNISRKECRAWWD